MVCESNEHGWIVRADWEQTPSDDIAKLGKTCSCSLFMFEIPSNYRLIMCLFGSVGVCWARGSQLVKRRIMNW